MKYYLVGFSSTTHTVYRVRAVGPNDAISVAERLMEDGATPVDVVPLDDDELVYCREDQHMTEPPKHPDISVQLSGEDGNAFAIIGRVSTALRRAGVSREEIACFRTEAMKGDYDALLATCMRWVNVQ